MRPFARSVVAALHGTTSALLRRADDDLRRQSSPKG
jgi:hypothetical protein